MLVPAYSPCRLCGKGGNTSFFSIISVPTGRGGSDALLSWSLIARPVTVHPPLRTQHLQNTRTPMKGGNTPESSQKRSRVLGRHKEMLRPLQVEPVRARTGRVFGHKWSQGDNTPLFPRRLPCTQIINRCLPHSFAKGWWVLSGLRETSQVIDMHWTISPCLVLESSVDAYLIHSLKAGACCPDRRNHVGYT